MAFDDSASVEVTLEASVDPDRLPLDLARRGLAQQSGTRYNSAMLETPVPLDASHLDEMYRVIDDAATAYRGVIPADCCPDPYMPRAELAAEMAAMQFYGCFAAGRLVAVMGVQDVQDVTLVRHAYVKTARQGQGFGSTLLHHAEAAAGRGTILVGTW